MDRAVGGCTVAHDLAALVDAECARITAVSVWVAGTRFDAKLPEIPHGSVVPNESMGVCPWRLTGVHRPCAPNDLIMLVHRVNPRVP